MRKILYLAMIATLLLSVAAVAVPTDAELLATPITLRNLDLNVRTHLVGPGQMTNVCVSEDILGFPIPWYCFDVKFCSLWGIVDCIQVGPTNRIGKADANYFLQPSIWEATAYGQKKGLLFWKCESDPIALAVAYKPGLYAAGELVGGCGKQFALAYLTPTPIGPGPDLPLGDPGTGFLYLDPACRVKVRGTEFVQISTFDSTIVFRGYGSFTYTPPMNFVTSSPRPITCVKPIEFSIFSGPNGPEFALNVYDTFPGCIIYKASGLVTKGGLLVL